MKNLAPLTLPVVNVVLALLITIGKNSESLHEGDTDTFFFPPIYGWVIIFLSIMVQLGINFPGANGGIDQETFNLMFLPITLAGVNFGMYLLRYRVIVSEKKFTVGAFWHKTYSISEIEKSELSEKVKASEYFVYLKGGKRIRFSGLLCDFQRLVFSLPAPRVSHGHGA